MTDLPEGFEYVEVSAAKDVVYGLIEEACREASLHVDPLFEMKDDEPHYNAITIADRIVEALVARGVTIPENFNAKEATS